MQMLQGKIVVVDGNNYGSNGCALERARWEARGLTVVVGGAKTGAEIVELAHDADVVAYMGLYTSFDASVLAGLTRCRLIGRYGIGIETVDVEAASRLGIVVANQAEYCVPEVADHAVALILAVARRIAFLNQSVRQGAWSEVLNAQGPVRRFSTQTVGLVGFGRIARRVAANLRTMAGAIVAYDPYVSPQAAAELGVEMLPLDELLAHSDYVSVHTPLTAETRGVIGAEQLAQMRPTAFIINTSRGPVIDEAALVTALQEGRIAGAALDVFAAEPLAADSPLRMFDNVVLTPHVAANSVEATDDLYESLIQSVFDIMEGYWPKYAVNPKITPRYPLSRLPSS
jgi:D-3-phosphoglycerate dehydrogenase / 2-oxoglutarate reductase